MTKLQRYYMSTVWQISKYPTMEDMCRSTDVSALEAENERLREALMRLFKANSTASSAVTLIAALEHAKAILNREHEKL